MSSGYHIWGRNGISRPCCG
ncbi:hypothetical protein Golax_018427, partial [Gossypium laxum]|nr:hypothetical protein [Gossypium laxum]